MVTAVDVAVWSGSLWWDNSVGNLSLPYQCQPLLGYLQVVLAPLYPPILEPYLDLKFNIVANICYKLVDIFSNEPEPPLVEGCGPGRAARVRPCTVGVRIPLPGVPVVPG